MRAFSVLHCCNVLFFWQTFWPECRTDARAGFGRGEPRPYKTCSVAAFRPRCGLCGTIPELLRNARRFLDRRIGPLGPTEWFDRRKVSVALVGLVSTACAQSHGWRREPQYIARQLTG
jgi:hypothetical protein